MTHHCTICGVIVNANCVRLGHVELCDICERYWVPHREPECPYCANAREKEEQRLKKEKEKEDKDKEKGKKDKDKDKDTKGKGRKNSSAKRKEEGASTA